MSTAPRFFVPNVGEDEQDSMYLKYAKSCGRPAPELSKRIYSISYKHDSDTWVATVGERLRGTRYKRKRVRGTWTERTTALDDPATVLAIFPDAPYMVVTDKGSSTNAGSFWENPFLAGIPIHIEYFAV